MVFRKYLVYYWVHECLHLFAHGIKGIFIKVQKCIFFCQDLLFSVPQQNDQISIPFQRNLRTITRKVSIDPIDPQVRKVLSTCTYAKMLPLLVIVLKLVPSLSTKKPYAFGHSVEDTKLCNNKKNINSKDSKSKF